MRELSFNEVEVVSGGWHMRAAEETFGFFTGIGRGFFGGLGMFFQWSDVGTGSDIVPPWTVNDFRNVVPAYDPGDYFNNYV